MKLKEFVTRLSENIGPLSNQPDPEMTVYVMATDRMGNSVKIPVTEIWGGDSDTGDGFDLIIEGNATEAVKPIDMEMNECGVFVAKILIESN